MESHINILIAEDEPAIAKKIQVLLEGMSWKPTMVRDLPELLQALSESKVIFEILVLDRMLGRYDSADHISTIREQYPTLKIFILSAIDSSLEKAKLIDAGADEYLAKPFESAELQARLKSLVRRTNPYLSKMSYSVANLSINLVQRNISVGGTLLNLTAKEFLVLHTLSGSVGKIFNKTQLIDNIWGFSSENETNVVESTVNSLRRKLEISKADVQIKNTRFIGYWLEI